MLLSTAIVFGFLGSLHCLGMCAPLVWAVPDNREKRMRWLTHKMLYNLGRISTYALLGLLIGLVGEGISLAGWQQHISWITGVVLLLGVVVHVWGKYISFFNSLTQQFNKLVKRGIGLSMGRKSAFYQFLFGVFNGFLPCGLVYMALIASLSMNTLGGSVTYMMLFGVGTLPMMLGVALFKQSITSIKTFNFNRIYPKLVVILAFLLIVRGLNLGIPYLSPKMNDSGQITVCETP